jgi:putative hydrolase of the HAD superfamily
MTWALEHAEEPADRPRYRRLDDLGGLAALVSGIG